MSCFALPEGFPTRSVCVFQDKSEIRDLEQRTVRAETLSGLGTMAATLAHELRTPLTAIAGHASMLRERLTGSPEEAEIAQKIERGVTSLETVTRQLLGFTETPELKKSWVSPAEIVLSALDMLPQKTRGSVSLSIGELDRSAGVDGDALQLRQAFLNLLLNACEAAGKGATVEVEAGGREDEAYVRVSDSGPGVPGDLAMKVFLPFFTTKEGGTGLGLAHSDKVVRAHGGRITLESAEKGAVFTVRLPLSRARERVVLSAHAVAPRAPLAGGRAKGPDGSAPAATGRVRGMTSNQEKGETGRCGPRADG